MRKKHLAMIAMVALCWSTLISLAILRGALPVLASASGLRQGASRQIKYTLYIGLSDSETQTQVLPVNEAQALVNEICAQYAPGYTSYQGQGGWTDGGLLIEEASLIYVIFDASEENIASFMDEVLTALNQSEILLEIDEVETLYYGS